MPALTGKVPVIESRQFTYCSAFYSARLEHEHFIVMTPDRREATERAWAFAREQWGEPTHVNVYPRNYVAKARPLYALGLHD